MAFPDSRLFIVDRDGKVLWDAVAEKRNETSREWEAINIFRASIITDRGAMERFVWGGGK